MNAFTEATDTILKQATFLGDEDLPLVVALKETARTLDADGVNASLVNQYRLTYLALSDKGKTGNEIIDPLEALLNV